MQFKYVKCNISDYGDNFEVIYVSDKWVINIKNNLDDAILKGNSELVMTLSAKETGNEVVGEAALILKLPTTDSETGLTFSKAYYMAYYPEELTGVIEFQSSLEFSNIDNPKDIVIALDSK